MYTSYYNVILFCNAVFPYICVVKDIHFKRGDPADQFYRIRFLFKTILFYYKYGYYYIMIIIWTIYSPDRWHVNGTYSYACVPVLKSVNIVIP